MDDHPITRRFELDRTYGAKVWSDRVKVLVLGQKLEDLICFRRLARSVTEWNKACDQHIGTILGYINRTKHYRHYCSVGDENQHCKLGIVQDTSFV